MANNELNQSCGRKRKQEETSESPETSRSVLPSNEHSERQTISTHLKTSYDFFFIFFKIYLDFGKFQAKISFLFLVI
jgi:hypothetical protein